MTYNRINKNKNYLLTQAKDQDRFMYCIHRARVSDVNIDEGTVSVNFEDVPHSTKVTIPLLGLSMPPKKNEDDLHELASSWGRYIPQTGDILLVGFGPNGKAYALGFHAVFYEGFTAKDIGRESTGGIGWGSSSAKDVKPGDWDFKSARGSTFYLGDKTRITSGPHSILLNKTTGDITSKSSLLIDSYGSSETRKGGARRKILPVDPSETTIYNLTAQVAQESTDVVRRGFPQIEMTRTSMGDVIDELTFQVMVSTLGGTTIRRLESVKDPTGLIDFYAKKVDDLGNYGVEAPTALLFQWLTPLSTWTITNNITTITSTTSFGVTAPIVNLTAPTQAVITSPNVQLGGPAAVEFLVKGTTFVSSMQAFLTAVQAAVAAVGSAPQNAAALTAIGAAATALNSALGGVLSVKVKTE